MPLSQVHYHFGSKGAMVLALLEPENRRRLARQAGDVRRRTAPLWRRYEQACDFLEDDLESGFVRVLQEMIAAGWSHPGVAEAARNVLIGWYELLTEVATEAAESFGGLGPFEPAEIATLIGNAFIGVRGAAAARLRPPAAADPVEPAACRRGHPGHRGTGANEQTGATT